MKIEVGTAYYPEVWTMEEIREDARRMKAAGITQIRVAEFAWSHMEPAEGVFQFQWLIDAVNLFGEMGIQTVMCTPSSAAPAWMCHNYPEVLRVNRDLVTKAWFGVRDHTCYTASKYREFCVRIARKMAEAFKDNPYISAWQIDNEPGCSRFGDCHCPECQQKFREFVKNRYGTLEELNKAWGTTFWSGEFYSWDEIELENRWENMASSRCLDSHRFRSDEQCEFILVQARAIKEVIPDAFIGTNNYVLRDRYKVFAGLDFAGNDIYPRTADDYNWQRTSIDLYRGLIPGGKPWMLETNTAPDWPRHDLTELYYWNFIGHGYDYIFYFNWNNHPAGNEKEHLTVICPTGQPGAKYEQIKNLIAKAKALPGEDFLPMPVADCAQVFEYDEHWTYALGQQNRYALVENITQRNHTALANAGLIPEIISDKFDFSLYKLLLLPFHPHMTPELAAKLEKYVEEGGVLLVNGRCGMFDANAKNIKVEGPQFLNKLLGLKVAENMPMYGISDAPEYDGKGADSPDTVVSGTLDGEKVAGTIGVWTGTVVPDPDTEVLLTFANSVLKDQPFLTCHKYGKGYALYYVTDAVNGPLQEKIVSYCAKLAKLPVLSLPDKLDYSRRGDLVFLCNFNDHAVEIASPWEGKNIHGEALQNGRIKLEALSHSILQVK